MSVTGTPRMVATQTASRGLLGHGRGARPAEPLRQEAGAD